MIDGHTGTYTQTDGHTHTHVGNDNTRRPKLASGKNGLHGRYITQTDLDKIYKHVFSVCATWEAQAYSLKNHCGFNTKSYCSDVYGYHRCPQTLAEVYRNMGICYSFRAVATREKYP